jgi:hypothetical protein
LGGEVKIEFLKKRVNLDSVGGYKANLKAFLLVLASIGIVTFSAIPASAYYSFYDITNTNETNASIAESQIAMEVTAYGANQVSFMFTNAVGEACSITDVYFDDGALLSIAGIHSSSEVSFDTPATPSNLPGGNSVSPPFVTSEQFSADSDTPVMANGVNESDEWLQIIFDLQSGKVFEDVIYALSLAGEEGGLRVGIHVQGFEIIGKNGETLSESLINNNDEGAPIPIPGAIWLLGSGLIGLVGFRKKLKKG